MFKWITGSDLRKGNVFVASTDTGHAVAIKVVAIRAGEMFVEVFGMENRWERVEDGIPMETLAEQSFLRVGK